MNTEQIILYGIGGPEKEYGVLGYYVIYDTNGNLTRTLQIEAMRLRMKNPSIKQFYMITNRYNLKRDYQESIRRNSIESKAMFKDILEREGIRILV